MSGSVDTLSANVAATEVSIAELVAAVAALPVSAAAREAARARLADTAFATLVGRDTAQGRAGAELTAALYGAQSLSAQAFRLAVACRLTEIDDIDLLSCITPGSIVIPTVLSVLSANPATRLQLDAVFDTIARGYELALALGEAMEGPRRLAFGVWPSLSVGGVTAAVLTSVLLGASVEDAQAAAVLAAQQSVSGNPRGNAREIQFAAALVTGIGSALAVQHGFSVAGTRGGGAVGGLLAADVSVGAETARIFRPSVKSFCSARQAMTAVVALRGLLATAGRAADEIDRIEVEVPVEYAAMLDKPVVTSRRESLASAQYQLALAMCEPDGLYDVARDRLHDDPRFQRTMAAVHIQASPELSALYPAQWPARVRISAGGRSYAAEVDEVPGERDFTTAAIQSKMRAFSPASTHDPERRAGAIEQISRCSLGSTDVDELRELATLIDGETAKGVRDPHVRISS